MNLSSRKISLKWKIWLQIILTLIICLAIFGFAVTRWVVGNLHREHQEKMQILAEGIVLHIKQDMLKGSGTDVGKLIDTFRKGRDVKKIEILKQNGEAAFRDLSTIKRVNEKLGREFFKREERQPYRVFSSYDTRFKRVIEVTKKVEFYEDGDLYTQLIPLINEESCHRCHGSDESLRGIVMISISTVDDRERIIVVEKRLFLFFAIITLMLSAILLWSMKVHVVMPLRNISKRVKRIIDDFNLFQPLEVASGDEIGDLALSFNKMVDALREKIDKIKETRDFLDRIMMSMGEGILVLDRNYRAIMVNDFLLNLTNRSREEVIGIPCYIAFHGLESECFGCNMIDAFKTGRSSMTIQKCKTKNGGLVDVEIRYYPVFDIEGKVIYVIESVKDIRERLKYEQELSRSEKLAAVGVLAAGVAHEIGNPLASISSLAETIGRKSHDQYTKKEIEVMISHIERISKIVRELVDFSRPPRYEPRKVQINNIVREAVSLSKYDKKLKGIDIISELEEDIPETQTVREKLLQVFMNMVWNSADAVNSKDGKGKLLITTRSDNNKRLKITFTDDGVGMSKEEIRRAFEPFYTTKNVGKGAGLGLFVSYGIIKNLGGSIEVESQKGKGTTFTIILPIEDI